jgi:hypothetical protein
MTLFITAALVVAVTFLLTLTVRTQDLPPAVAISPTQHLEDRKAQIYENLRDLQFEYRVGKLSDEDYQQTKVGLQKELAGVLKEIERVIAGLPAGAVAAEPVAPVKDVPPAADTVCPHCNATMPKPMKFCGECGKAMS